MMAVLIMDVTCGSRRDLNKGHPEFGENTGEDLLLILGEITTGLLLDDLKVIDKHFGSLKVDLGLPSGGMGNEPKTEGGLLGIHHDKFDEALGEIGGVGGLLDFGHGIIGS